MRVIPEREEVQHEIASIYCCAQEALMHFSSPANDKGLGGDGRGKEREREEDS